MEKIDFFKEAKKNLDLHGIIAFKTDTVMGIGVDGRDSIAVSNLFKLKKRSFDKPLYMLAYSIAQIFEYARAIPYYAYDLMKKHFPGGLTLIFYSSHKLFTSPNTIGDTIGVRIANSRPLNEFLAYIGIPLLNTSANISGEQPMLTKEEVNRFFGDKVFFVDFDLLLCNRRLCDYNIQMSGLSSTVVDCTGSKPKLLREGSVNPLREIKVTKE